MATSEKKADTPGNTFNPTESIKRARSRKSTRTKWNIVLPGGKKYSWRTKMERVAIIRKGLPYNAIETIGKKANLPAKKVYGELLGIPQTTYNQKKKAKEKLSSRDTELILVLSELLDYGLQVFNNEIAKFQRWLKKPNIALGNITPESLFDSLTGIQEVKKCLNRLEYGNMA